MFFKAKHMRVVLAGAALALGLSVFGSSADARELPSQKHLKVAIFSVNGASPSIHEMIESAVKAAKARGWTVETYDGNGDQVATNNQVNTFITRGFNALINIASDNHEMAGVIANADKHHIPFVSTFSGLVPGITVDIGDNNVVDGAISASEMVARLNGKGHVVKLNWTVLPALAERDRGFWAVVKGYPGIKVTSIQVKVPGQVQDTYNRLTDLLHRYHNIGAVWVGWDEIAIPAVRAIQQAKSHAFVVSEDGIPPVFDLIREHTPMALTVAYDVKGMGVAAVQAVADAVDGKTFAEHQIYKRPCLITRQTVPPKGELPNYKTCALFSADIELK